MRKVGRVVPVAPLVLLSKILHVWTNSTHPAIADSRRELLALHFALERLSLQIVRSHMLMATFGAAEHSTDRDATTRGSGGPQYHHLGAAGSVQGMGALQMESNPDFMSSFPHAKSNVRPTPPYLSGLNVCVKVQVAGFVGNKAAWPVLLGNRVGHTGVSGAPCPVKRGFLTALLTTRCLCCTASAVLMFRRPLFYV